MKTEDVEIGTKVVPHSKSVAIGTNDMVFDYNFLFQSWRDNFGKRYSTVTHIMNDYRFIHTNGEMDTVFILDCGNYFLSRDFEKYTEV